MSVKAIVLAAGKGTRMKSDLAKVLHPIAGRPLVAWVIDALSGVDVADTVVVVGHQAGAVAEVLPEGAKPALQEPQLGTGHAASVGLAALDADPDDTVVVLPGDMPLLRPETVAELVDLHQASGVAATMVTVVLEDPTGYGRVIRRGGAVLGVVEQRDADPEQLGIREVCTSIYAFRAGALGTMLERLETDNDQGEYYLTDVIGHLTDAGEAVTAVEADPVEGLGVNSHEQLATAAKVIRRRINRRHLEDGVWMLDPERVYLDADVEVGPGARLYPDVYLEQGTTVGAETVIGPSVVARRSAFGREVTASFAVVEDSRIGDGATIGPFARLRGGTVIGPGAKAGTFVEMKNTQFGGGAKAAHLAYLGDATVGEDTVVGAGAITCNFDGSDKHSTTIGRGAFIGSNTMLVAPVTIHDGAMTAAGSVITRDVSPDALGVGRSPQREIPGYAARRRRRTEEQDP